METTKPQDAKKILALCASARSDGNSRKLAEAVLAGAAEAGHQGELVQLSEQVTGLLRNCRECRNSDGQCTIDDGYEDILLNKYLQADAIIYASPIYWYGLSGHLKNFIDRFFCYIVEGYPKSGEFVEKMMGKRAALVMSAEENNFSARLANMQGMTQLCDYLHHQFVGVVCTTANSRTDVQGDPTEPLAAARTLGRNLFDITETNYRIDTVRGNVIWKAGEPQYKHPAYWR